MTTAKRPGANRHNTARMDGECRCGGDMERHVYINDQRAERADECAVFVVILVAVIGGAVIVANAVARGWL